jgi:hypothetical protein
MKLELGGLQLDDLHSAGRASIAHVDHLYNGYIDWVERNGDDEDLYRALYYYVQNRTSYAKDEETNRRVLTPIIDRMEDMDCPSSQIDCYLASSLLTTLDWPEKALIFARRAYQKASSQEAGYFQGHSMKLLALRIELGILLTEQTDLDLIGAKLQEYVWASHPATIHDDNRDNTWRKLSVLDLDRDYVRAFLITDWANLLAFQRQTQQDVTREIEVLDKLIKRLPPRRNRRIKENDPHMIEFAEMKRNAPVYHHDWTTFEGGSPPLLAEYVRKYRKKTR